VSIAATLAAARRELAVLHTATCEIRTAATQWAANPSTQTRCKYTATSPQAGDKLDYEGGNGYGYTVEFLTAPVAIKENDTVVIVASPNPDDVGTKIQVQQIPARGNNGLVYRIDGVKRDG
jgi:hypothetical protein